MGDSAASRSIPSALEPTNSSSEVSRNLRSQRSTEKQAEHNTIQDVIRLCKERLYTTVKDLPKFLEPLVCFHVRAAPYRVKSQLSSEGELDYGDLLEHCVHHLSQVNSPALETIRLQVTAQAATFLELKACAEERRSENRTLKAILSDIPQIQVVDMRETFKTVELLHGRILDYMIEHGRQMADISYLSSEMEQEIATALNSVFPHESCLFWMDIPAREKERQISEMAAVIQGIRLYNKHLSKGGEELNLPYDLYKLENKTLSEKVFQLLHTLNDKIRICAHAITVHIHSLGMQHVLIQRLRDELNYHLQAFAILQDFQSFLDERFAYVTGLMDQSLDNLNTVCEVIENRQCIATELVFPQFIALGNIHASMLAELRLLRAHERSSIHFISLVVAPHFQCTPAGIANLCCKTKCARSYYTDWKNTPIGLSKLQVLISYTSFLPKEMYSVSWKENEDLFKRGLSEERLGKVLTSVEVEEASKGERNIHLAGYCPVTLANYRGLLLHGDLDIGLVEFEEQLYAFSTKEDLNQFAKKPAVFLKMVENVVCKMPQLVHLLRLDRCPKFSFLSISRFIDILNEPFSCEFSTQTSIHNVQCHGWTSETQYKRVLELNHKLTDSSQTESSYFKRSSYTQLWLPKEKWTQTMLNKGTKMTRHIMHLHGLVGPPTVQFKLLRAEYDV